ncbi:MAG TPA: TRAP transporter fused permease subunit [Ferrovibrio sp.]|uniref:TRAP transporter permease n=1 Tax=Ferrovibrio sp. TaxID=1917215 RepID=UPI002ED5ED6E
MQTEDAGARPGWLLISCAAITVGIHVWLIFTSLVPNLVSRPLHFAAALPWVFLFARGRGRIARWIGVAAVVAGWVGTAYLIANRRAILDQYGSLDGSLWQWVLAFGLILVTLEMARRAVQPVLPGVAVLCLLYGFFGQYLPGALGHPELPPDYFLGSLVLAEGGLWGQLTGISVDLIVPFMILGAAVSAGEAGRGFMAMAMQLAGGYRAGAAKVSVLASALYGTISGSASANVASVGAITIPAMIRMGYPRPLAAAVEAVASTGGQIMPPVMGSAAFVMAELIRKPYADVAIASILPAVLFFFAAWIGVHFFALRFGLKGLTADELPGWRAAIASVPFFAAPLVILILMLLVLAYSPAYSAMIATAVTVAMLIWNGEKKRPSPSLFVQRLKIAAVDAARQIALIAAILICAGLIVGVFHATGLGVKITGLILDLSGGRLWAALLLTALACTILGMELPTTAAYLICVAVAGPALVKLGLPELHAHMFVFWYALLCTITPPVCGTVFVAASIAGTPWLPVAGVAMRIGLGLFLIPIGFVANPALMQIATAPGMALLAMVKIGLALALISYALIGDMRAWLRKAAAFAAGLALMFLYGVA